MAEVDMAGSYIRACAKYGVEPAVELLVALRSGGDIECALSHRIHPLADVAVEAMVEGLMGVKAEITLLDLEGNAVTWKGAKALTALLEGSNVHTVKLGENALEDTGCKLIAACVTPSRSLGRLDLRANRISGLGAISIGDMLRANSSVTHLSLQKNSIDDSGCGSIASGVQGNHTLKHLSLRFNDISDRGVADVVGVLPECSLTSLDVGGNSIGPEGATALANSLCTEWSSLSKINLRSNAAGEEGVLAFASALENPLCTLKELFIGFNTIPKQPAIQLLGALQRNKHLIKLDLQGVVLNVEGEQAVAALVTSNHTLTQLVTELEPTPDAGKLAAGSLLENTTLEELSVGDVEGVNNASALITLVLRCNKLLHNQHSEEGKRVTAALIAERRQMRLPVDRWETDYSVVVSKLEEHKSLLQQTRTTSGNGGHSMGEDNLLTAGQDIVSRGLAGLPSPAPSPASPAAHNMRSTVSSLMDAATPYRQDMHATPSTVAAGPGQAHRVQQKPLAEASLAKTASPLNAQRTAHPTPVPPPNGSKPDLQNSLHQLEEGLKPQLSDMADLIEGLQRQNMALAESQVKTEKKIGDIISVLGHSLDIKAGEALRDQSELALQRTDKISTACEQLAQQVATLSNEIHCASDAPTAPAGDMTPAFAAVDTKVNSLEMALTDMASKVGQALGKQEEALHALQEALTETRGEQEIIGVSAEKAVRYVAGQVELINGKMDSVEQELTLRIESNSERALMDPAFNNKVIERLEVLEENTKWTKSRLEAIEVENAHTIQAQSSQRLKLDTLSKKLEEMQAAPSSDTTSLELTVAECKAANAQLNEKLMSLEERVPRKMENKVKAIEGTLERHQASLMAWQVPVEEATSKAVQALQNSKVAVSNTEKLTQSVNNITAEWCEGLSALRPKIEELRASAEGHEETKQRLTTVETMMAQGLLRGQEQEQGKGRGQVQGQVLPSNEVNEGALEMVLKQQQMVLNKISPLVEEVNNSRANISVLQNSVATLQARAADDRTEQYKALDTMQQHMKILASEVQKAPNTSLHNRTADELYTTGSQSGLMSGTETEREELAKELQLLRRETSEAHVLTNELRRRISEREALSPGRSDEKMQHLMNRIDLLEEVLKRDQKASLIALEAILAERSGPQMPPPLQPHQFPSPSVGSRPVTPPPGQWERQEQPESAPSVPTTSPATARLRAMKEMENITHQILSSRGINVGRPQGPLFGTPATTPGKHGRYAM